MGPVVYVNVVVIGMLVFAALHYFLLWWWSRRERALLVFALFCALVCGVSAVVVMLITADSVAAAQRALDLRTTLGFLAYPLLVLLVCEIASVRPPWALTLVTVAFVLGSIANAFGASLNGVVTGVRPAVMPWGEELAVIERHSIGLWAAPGYLLLFAVQGFALSIGWRAWRRDKLASALIVLTGTVAIGGLLVSALFDVLRLPMPYFGTVQFAIWVPVLSIVLSRENVRRDERLAASEGRFRTLTETAPEAIVVLDVPSGRFVDGNQKAVDLFGWTLSELVEMGPLEVSAEHQPDGVPTGEGVAKRLQQALDGAAPFFDWVIRTRDGRSVPCEVRFVRLPDPTRILIRGSVTDVSERKRAEAQLHDIESRHTAILESSLDGLIVVDSSSRIVEFNPAAETIFGHRRQDCIGRALPELLIPPALREAHRAGLERYLKTGVSTVIGRRLEMPALRADGTEVRVELSIQPIKGSMPTLFAGVVRDITERLRLEEQLRQSQKMEAIGQLAGGVAHDFNNLLTVIAGYCGILLDKLPLDDPLRDDVRAISDAGHRAASLTQRLLAFSRQAVMTPKVVDINAVVRETEHILRRLIGEDILLTVVLDPTAGHVKVDPGQLGQVLINLAVNARDAMPAGGRMTIRTGSADVDTEVRVSETETPPGRYVRLVVSDTGVGMSPELKARIFEPFFTTKGVGRGTGLGLSVVHGIVKQSGGYIDVESEEGTGSTFSIAFPLVEHVPAATVKVPADVSARGVETILLVEDEDAVRHLLARGLRNRGFTVMTASDGAEALRMSRERPGRIDLLATDLVMPNMSGRELADRLRQERGGLKVLFMSGYTDDTLLRHGVYEAGETFLQKPFALQAFASKVREVLDQRND